VPITATESSGVATPSGRVALRINGANDAHSSIMSGSSSVDDAIAAATKQIKDQVLTN
jgi:hypothetical protein